MRPDQIKACRKALKLSQENFAAKLGVSRLSINHYEHGFRHDNGREVQIPLTFDMACTAAWLRFDSFADLAIEVRQDESKDGISFGEIDRETFAAGKKLLEALAIEPSKYSHGFKMSTILRHWNEITEVYCRNELAMPRLYFCQSPEVPCFALIDFIEQSGLDVFRYRWSDGKFQENI